MLSDVSTPNPAAPGRAATSAVDIDVPEQMRIRRDKRERLLTEGGEAYPVVVPRTHTLAEIRAAYPDLEPTPQTGLQAGVAGRVIFVRNTGKLCFATLQEGDGTKLQAMISLAVSETTRWRPGRPMSTSVTSCSCTARSSPPARGELERDGRFLVDGGQVASPAAGGAQGDERGVARSSALCRPDRASRGQGNGPYPRECGPCAAQRARAPRLPRGRDPDAADACTAAPPRARS